MGSHFGGLVNSPPIVEPILMGIGMLTHGDWDAHWGCDLDFDPCSCNNPTPVRLLLVVVDPPAKSLTFWGFSGKPLDLSKG